jgi:hypothetical protein
LGVNRDFSIPCGAISRLLRPAGRLETQDCGQPQYANALLIVTRQLCPAYKEQSQLSSCDRRRRAHKRCRCDHS